MECHLVDYFWNEGHVADEWSVMWLMNAGLSPQIGVRWLMNSGSSG